MHGSQMWDERYSSPEYVFGTDAAAFLTRHAHLLAPDATALVVADGEGRNSVFLAEQGLRVTATDISPVGVDKARRLAAERRVEVDFRVADVLTWDWEPDAYDLVVAVFIQFLSPEQRPGVFAGLARTLAPGGQLLLHGYRPEQVALGTGGPPDPSHMYTEDLLRDAFGHLEVEVLESYEATLTEGAGHAGPSALIDLVARKPAAG